jgi:hypothetical protein
VQLGFLPDRLGINFYLGRDHVGKRLGVPTVPKPK